MGPYAGTDHGFAVRGDDADARVHAAKEDVVTSLAAFVHKTVAARK